MSDFTKFLLQAGFGIVLINVIGLWGIAISQQRQIHELNSFVYSSKPNSTPTPEVATKSSTTAVSSPSADTIDVVQDIEDLSDRVELLEKNKKTTSSASTNNSPKESSIFIGSGSSTDTNWKNIDSAVVTLNADNYPNITEVRFEAALSILSGNAYARVVNKNTGDIINTSEIYHNTSTNTWKTSAPITLQSGTQTYIVQIKSSSNENAVMSASRIRIITQ